MRRDAFWKHIRPDDWNITLDYIQACRQHDVCVKQYHRASDLPADITWEKGTEMILALWKDGSIEESIHLIKKGKKIILKPGYTPRELFLLHEALLVLEEVNN